MLYLCKKALLFLTHKVHHGTLIPLSAIPGRVRDAEVICA